MSFTNLLDLPDDRECWRTIAGFTLFVVSVTVSVAVPCTVAVCWMWFG